ncbi:hypothetical protein ACIA5E_25325 [Nocardia asteroides]|uniref:hypothetical protein n=1 Tax=Nocardia asteroides TaxID=1824 RepID=UPI003798D153
MSTIMLAAFISVLAGYPAAAAPTGGGSSDSLAVPLQTATAALTTTEPGAATGLRSDVEFRAAQPWGRPYSVNNIAVRFPAGFTVDFSAVPICRASDLELYLRGPGICADSIIGAATAKVDFGWPNSERIGGPYEQFLLGDGELIIFENNQLGKPAADGFTLAPLIFRTPLSDNGFSMFIPEGPSLALPDLLWALRSIELRFDDRGVFRTPDTCDPSGAWTLTVGFTYYMGATDEVTTSLPCTG